MFIYSQHFLRQIELRSISVEDINNTLSEPDNTIAEDGLIVYQKVIIQNNKVYLLRIFVNEDKQPPVAVTAYKTSKINKYNLL